MKDPKDRSARSPWARNAANPLVNPGAHDRVNFTDAVAFIVEQLAPGPAYKRIEGDKVRKRVRTAIGRDDLRQDSDGKIVFGELMTWGCSHSDWRDALAPFPSLNPGAGAVNSAPMQVGGRGHAIPSDAAEMEAALRAANVRIHELEDAGKAKDEELARLRPLEIKALKKVSDGRIFGKIGGRPRKR